MFEAQFFQVEAVNEGVYEPDRVSLSTYPSSVSGKRAVWFLLRAFYVFAHGSSVALKLV